MRIRRDNIIIRLIYFGVDVPKEIPTWRFLIGLFVVLFGAATTLIACCLGFLVAKRPPLDREEFESLPNGRYFTHYTSWPTIGGHRIWPIVPIGILAFLYSCGVNEVVFQIRSLAVRIDLNWILVIIGLTLVVGKGAIEDWVETRPLYRKITHSFARRWEAFNTITTVDDHDEYQA